MFEKVPGSGIWWIRYFDAQGKKIRVSVGTHAAAVALYDRRKANIRAGILNPPTARRNVKFVDLVSDALQYYADKKLKDASA